MDPRIPPPEPEGFRDFCYSVGFALLQAQMLERSIASYLTLAYKLQPQMALARAMEILQETSRRTLGQVLAELKQKATDLDGLDARLDQFCRERNWLVHRLRHENGDDVFRAERLAGLTARVHSFAREAYELMHVFNDRALAFMAGRGHDNAEIERRALEIMRRRLESG